MSILGIIANPAAGKDIRRLVALGRFVSDHEKVNVIKRVLAGLKAVGVQRVLMMPDWNSLGRVAAEGISQPEIIILEMPVYNEGNDSTRAAELMVEMGVDCLVTLGGDGTSRAVSKSSGDVPMVAVSTGTNNVFPDMVEGTVAGMAAGVVANNLVDLHTATSVVNRLEIETQCSGKDIALVDVAVSRERFTGARAIWNPETLYEIFLVSTDQASIGLSAIGARLRNKLDDENSGMRIILGTESAPVIAPIAPGMVVNVPISNSYTMRPNEAIKIGHAPCTIALDGERTLSLSNGETAEITLTNKGPRVVSVEEALRQASIANVFRVRPSTGDC